MAKDRYVFYLFVLIGIITMVALTGCGGKSQEQVMKKIEKKLAAAEGYKAIAEMTMKTGREDRNYEIDVWFKKGKMDFYRVNLENEADEGGQVILKNEEGVFVLTPVLKKSFKFQSDWPENSGQPYLYQSLVHDVFTDKEATLTTDDSHYIFMTKTNYQNNKNLPYQEIYFDKKSFIPTAVKVMDQDKNVLIEVTFNEINLNPEFQDKDFDREAILENALANVSSTVSGEEHAAVLFPLVTKGAELVEKKEITMENGTRVIMTFKGERNFSLIQEHQKSVPTVATPTQEVSGQLVHLGHSIGAVTNDALEWNYQGTDFYLASEEMTVDELIEVAASVQGQEMK